MQLTSCFGLSVLAAVGWGCGDNLSASAPTDATPRDTAGRQVPTSAVVESGIRREVYRMDGGIAPANPVTGVATPAAYNRTQISRYRQDVTPPAPARAVLIMVPGVLGGAGSFDTLARSRVRAAKAQTQVLEVGAIDRRSNLQEDTIGFDTAEMLGDPEIAEGYYFQSDTIDGRPFAGALDQGAASYMSEWGLTIHIEDLRRVIEQVGAADRRGHVFLGGHSLGASVTEAYAAWAFADGVRGFDQLAGLVLIDGVLAASASTEAQWKGGQAGGLLNNPGVDKQRSVGPRYVELPVFGALVFARVELMAARALLAPDAVIVDQGRDDLLEFQLFYPGDALPRMTNAAAFGWALDDDSDPLVITAASLGEPIGGPVERYDNLIAMRRLQRPLPTESTFGWKDASASDPENFTPLANFARAFVDGPTNFAEWYFPLRLASDLGAVGGARVAPGSYQVASGLAASEGAAIDAPVLAVSAGLVPAASFDALRSRLLTPVGAGRRNAGATRAQSEGFQVVTAAGFTHIDPLTAADRVDNPVPSAILQFVLANAASGTVTVPAAQP
jgi:hypothetical protein